MAQRKATINRSTKETTISVTVNIDGTGNTSIKTGINFIDHLITSFGKHGMMDLKVNAKSNDGIEHHLIEDTAITIGTTAITFSQFSGAGQITAGAGLTKSGNTINVVGTANRLSVAADAIDIDSNYVGQATITTLGTLTTGEWAADDVAVTHGGTGVSSHTGKAFWVSNAGGTALSYITGTQYQHLGFSATGVPQASGTIDGGTF